MFSLKYSLGKSGYFEMLMDFPSGSEPTMTRTLQVFSAWSIDYH